MNPSYFQRNEKNIDVSLTKFRALITKNTWRKMGSWDRENFGTVFFDASKNKARYAMFNITVEPPEVLRIGRDAYISEERFSKYVAFHTAKLRDHDFDYYERIRNLQLELIERLNINSQRFIKLCDVASFNEVYENLAQLHVLFDFDRSLSDAIEIMMHEVQGEGENNSIQIDQVFNESHETQALNFVKKLREIKSLNLTDEVLDNELTAVVSEYGHLGFYQFKGDAFTAEDMARMIQDMPVRNSHDESIQPDDEISEHFKALVSLAQLFSQHRLQRVETTNAVFFKLQETLNQFFSERGVSSYRDLVCPQVEIVGNGESLCTPIISHDHTVIHISHERITRLTSKAVENFLATNSVVEKPSQLKGTRASGGRHIGIARVVLDPSSNHEFKNGDILVCSMTDPNFLPLMFKAGAFITEKGGILCHAAILARELGKPCLIGVQGLLDMINDGMEIEVDCESEQVKVLSCQQNF